MDCVLFLDIDGVLNTSTSAEKFGTYDIFDEQCVRQLNRILKETQCKLVISSSWRLSGCNFPKDLTDRGVILSNPFCDITIDLYGHRCAEILEWLSRHKSIEKYAAIDDMDLSPLHPNFFKTNSNYGLTTELADLIIRHLIKGD